VKMALIVNHVTNIEANFRHIVDAIHKCVDDKTDLILFPEAAITGLINDDNPLHDILLGSPIPGEFTNTLTEVARDQKIHIGIGILEREGNKLYDSAILITPDKGIVLKYRRMTSGWHGKHANPKVYCEGNEFKKVETALGTFAFLICGDLFDDDLIAQVQKLQPDWLLFPFARCFRDGTYDQEKWDKEEKSKYIERVKIVRVITFMVNYLADKKLDGGSFGGAMVVLPTCEVIAEMPIGREGVLYVEI